MIGEASSGAEGLLLANQLKPDIALIDLNIKGMNGLQMLKEIRKEMMLSRCIVLTAYNKVADFKDAHCAGVDGYLLKGLEPEDLCNCLRKAMSGAIVLDENMTKIYNNSFHPTISNSEEVSLGLP